VYFLAMRRLVRSPRLACLTLAAFLLAQPIVGCALLCLADHHAGLHEMVGMNRPSASGNTACHTGIETATRRGPAQTLSFMEPAAPPPMTRIDATAVPLPTTRPAAVPQASPGLDPPPPRLV
jgi:hypothetical protein